MYGLIHLFVPCLLVPAVLAVPHPSNDTDVSMHLLSKRTIDIENCPSKVDDELVAYGLQEIQRMLDKTVRRLEDFEQYLRSEGSRQMTFVSYVQTLLHDHPKDSVAELVSTFGTWKQIMDDNIEIPLPTDKEKFKKRVHYVTYAKKVASQILDRLTAQTVDGTPSLGRTYLHDLRKLGLPKPSFQITCNDDWLIPVSPAEHGTRHKSRKRQSDEELTGSDDSDDNDDSDSSIKFDSEDDPWWDDEDNDPFIQDLRPTEGVQDYIYRSGLRDFYEPDSGHIKNIDIPGGTFRDLPDDPDSPRPSVMVFGGLAGPYKNVIMFDPKRWPIWDKRLSFWALFDDRDEMKPRLERLFGDLPESYASAMLAHPENSPRWSISLEEMVLEQFVPTFLIALTDIRDVVAGPEVHYHQNQPLTDLYCNGQPTPHGRAINAGDWECVRQLSHYPNKAMISAKSFVFLVTALGLDNADWSTGHPQNMTDLLRLDYLAPLDGHWPQGDENQGSSSQGSSSQEPSSQEPDSPGPDSLEPPSLVSDTSDMQFDSGS